MSPTPTRLENNDMADPNSPTATPAPPADSTAANLPTLADPPAARRVAPIPPTKGAGNVAAKPAVEGERDEHGRFVKRVDGLPELLQETSGVEDEHDRAKTTLDGGEPERVRPLDHTTKKGRAKDALIVAAPGADGDDAPVDGEPADAPADTDPAKPATSAAVPLTAATPFTIAGETFRDAAHLDQNYRTLRGMYNAADKRAREAERASRTNYESALAWAARAQGRTPTADGSGAAPGTPSPGDDSAAADSAATKVASATGATKESILKSIDWNLFKKIRETHDDTTAIVWVMENALKTLEQRYDARLDEMTRPNKEAQVLAGHGMAIGEQMDAMAAWNYEGSNDPIYPELQDDGTREEIANIAVALHGKGISLDFLKTPEGVHNTVLTWRDWRSRQGKPYSATRPTSAPTAVPDTTAAAVASVRAAASSAGAVRAGGNAPARAAAPTGGVGQDIVAGILGAAKPTDMGWAR